MCLAFGVWTAKLAKSRAIKILLKRETETATDFSTLSRFEFASDLTLPSVKQELINYINQGLCKAAHLEQLVFEIQRRVTTKEFVLISPPPPLNCLLHCMTVLGVAFHEMKR